MALIKPQDLIEEFGVDGLCATADSYFEEFDLTFEQMRKPFSSLADSPRLLRSLGTLLQGLEARRGMTVLDFGAGTCWLSRYLAQMGCATVSVDASAKALELGKQWYEHIPPALMPRPPQFLVFDGHRIDLPDASVDRIISFDAFHHVANPKEVIAEFARVLKPGGIAGFSEPGPYHSQSAQSQLEMRQFKVLENDIVVEDLEVWALAAGFTRTWVELSFFDDRIALSPSRVGKITRFRGLPGLDALRRLFLGAMKTLVNQQFIYMAKGPLEIDSRWVEGLAHEISLVEAPTSVVAGQPFALRVRVKNIGSARWLCGEQEDVGNVNLAVGCESGEVGRPMELGRFLFPRSLGPGEEVEFPVELVCEQPGPADLRVDLVAEHISWFELVGSKALEVHLEVVSP